MRILYSSEASPTARSQSSFLFKPAGILSGFSFQYLVGLPNAMLFSETKYGPAKSLMIPNILKIFKNIIFLKECSSSLTLACSNSHMTNKWKKPPFNKQVFKYFIRKYSFVKINLRYNGQRCPNNASRKSVIFGINLRFFGFGRGRARKQIVAHSFGWVHC